MFRKVSLLLMSIACCSLQVSQGKPPDLNVKACGSIDLIYPYPNADIAKLMQMMRSTVGGCQFVSGDVTIKNFGLDLPWIGLEQGNVGQQLETDFFDSIEEIEGRLHLFRVSVKLLIFRNLRVIRGNIRPGRQTHEKAAMLIEQLPFPMKLAFPKLTAIGSGNLRLRGPLHSDVFCYVLQKLDENLLLHDRAKGQDFEIARDIDLPDCANEPADCDSCRTEVNGSGLCWSNHPEGCQARIKNGCREAARCQNNTKFCYQDAASGMQQCCSIFCMGGCSGRSSRDCDSCLPGLVSRVGACDNDCWSPRHSYDTRTSKYPMYQLGSVCVKDCPRPYLAVPSKSPFGGTCELQCRDFEMPRDGVCRPCEDCKWVCIFTPVYNDSSAQTQSKGCRLAEVQLKFNSSLELNAAHLKNPESLEFISDVRAFYGRLYVGRMHLLGLTGLDFLRNLEFVSNDLIIMLMRVRYLGLAQLRFAGSLELFRVDGLCRAWYPASHVAKLRRTFAILERYVTFDDESTVCKSAACHPSCLSECWGPGPTMCVAE